MENLNLEGQLHPFTKTSFITLTFHFSFEKQNVLIKNIIFSADNVVAMIELIK